MIDSNILDYSKLEPLRVSRETCSEFEELRSLIIQKNKKINLISTKTEGIIRERHIIDSAQAIDFIDKNDNICTDIGSGSGFPGIVLAIIMKHRKTDIKFNLYEKSYHKSKFLEEVSKKLKLNTEIYQRNIFEERNLISDVVVARAFKPLPVILNLMNSNFKKFRHLILFLGKSGKENLDEALSKWEFEYKQKRSLTNNDSFLINISKLKKKSKDE